MARPLRLQFPGAIYHVTSRGNSRQKVFFTDADRELFLRTLSRVVSRYGWICHAYCLMANHYHLLIEIALLAQIPSGDQARAAFPIGG